MATVGNHGLPSTLAAPARRALAAAGITELGQLTTVTEADIAQLHGMGPKAIQQLREALANCGASFADRGSTADGVARRG